MATGHRHWRFTLDATTPDNSGYTMAEVQFRTSIGVPLTPSGGTPSAADTYVGAPGYDPGAACDGDLNTIWSSNTPNQPQWWAYDYGAGNAPNIVEMAITARGQGYPYQTPTLVTPGWSDDGVTWTLFPQVALAEWAEFQTQAFALGGETPPVLTPQVRTLVMA